MVRANQEEEGWPQMEEDGSGEEKREESEGGGSGKREIRGERGGESGEIDIREGRGNRGKGKTRQRWGEKAVKQARQEYTWRRKERRGRQWRRPRFGSAPRGAGKTSGA